MTTELLTRDRSLRTIVPIWLASALGAVLIGVLAPSDSYLAWLPIVLAAAVFTTFCIQLATLQKEGFVNRVMASIGGALVVLALATAVLGAIAVANG